MKYSDAVRRQSRRFVRSLRLPPVDNVRDLLPAVEERSGHPIRIVPSPADNVGGVCGLWIRMADGVDYVFVDEKTSRAHQDHIIAHELAHILCNHQGFAALPQAGPDSERPVPTLDPSVVRMMLGRTDYAHGDETEAELVGTYLQRHVHRPRVRVKEHDRVAETLLGGHDMRK
ncbi:hypothetical protein OG373_36960 [Streptomyces avidinii]|uniref:hypothetical protein n=1 Tax=Streptomyces avidinii TaxID=1895 RepID=UPI003870AFA4|nr:hypothetical protein OG373_36960 [Streptomyces avidinii]